MGTHRLQNPSIQIQIIVCIIKVNEYWSLIMYEPWQECYYYHKLYFCLFSCLSFHLFLYYLPSNPAFFSTLRKNHYSNSVLLFSLLKCIHPLQLFPKHILILSLSLWTVVLFLSLMSLYLSSRPSQCCDQPHPSGEARVWGRTGTCGVADTFDGGFSSDFPLPRSPAGCACLLEVGARTLLSWWLPKGGLEGYLYIC